MISTTNFPHVSGYKYINHVIVTINYNSRCVQTSPISLLHEKRQFQFTDGRCERESRVKVGDVIDELLQIKATAARSDYVVDVALV